MCKGRSGRRGSKGRKYNFIGLIQLPHPYWANDTGEHEGELKCLGSLCDCWLSAQEEIAFLTWCQDMFRIRFRNLILEVFLCNSGHEVHRSLSQWGSLHTHHINEWLQSQRCQDEGVCLKALKRDNARRTWHCSREKQRSIWKGDIWLLPQKE